jgi:peptidoglycan hydrolase-like protein with peptidoglycan-binding domain
MHRTISSLLLLLALGTLTAQDLFTVRVGIFRDVKVEEFSSLKPLGFVYGIPGTGNTTEVFVGHFSTQDKSTGIAADLLKQGYRNAQAFALPVGISPKSTFIQIALHSGSRRIEWAALERSGQLFVETTDGLSKIMTGPFASAQAAAAALPGIKILGYRDAFVKQVDPARLVTISTFETGIKKPLIPINLQGNTPPPTTQQPRTTEVTLNPTPGPATYGSGTPLAPAPAPTATTSPTTPPVVATTTTEKGRYAYPPNVSSKFKRQSAAELQRVLKEKGFYESSIDGYYGPGTTAAFQQAWASQPELQKYKVLATMQPDDQMGDFWQTTYVLLAIADDMAAGTTSGARAEQMMQQRKTIFSSTTPLSPAAATRVKNWAATVWSNLDDWATEDPLHAQIFSAFRVTYHQTQIHLEDHFLNKGLNDTEARDLATAVIQNLIGAKLDRFL